MLGAIEYTVTVLQSPDGCVVALPPSTIEVVNLNSDIEDHLREVEVGQFEQEVGQAVDQVPLYDDMDPDATFFSYGRKYQPNEEVRTHTPPKLESRMVQVRLQRRSADGPCASASILSSSSACPLHVLALVLFVPRQSLLSLPSLRCWALPSLVDCFHLWRCTFDRQF